MDTTLIRYHYRLVRCKVCVCCATNMMMICQQVRRIQYVTPYVLFLFLLCWREATFCIYKIVHVSPPPPFFHPDSLGCWCLRHETALSFGALGGLDVGDLGTPFGGWGFDLCRVCVSPGMWANPSTCECSPQLARRVSQGGGVPLVGLQKELRSPSAYTPRSFTSSPGREAK